MRWPLHLCGTIHDLALSVSWDRNSLIEQVDRRVGILCDLGVRPGNPVAICSWQQRRFRCRPAGRLVVRRHSGVVGRDIGRKRIKIFWLPPIE